MKVLVVAPHADDEVLGMGGTIARFADEGHNVYVAIMTGHGEEGEHPIYPREEWEKIRAEAQKAHEILHVKETLYREIPAVLVAETPSWKVNKITEDLLAEVRPDVLYLPFQFDMHRDHREIFHSFSVAYRPNSEVGKSIRGIYSYEVMSETHWSSPYLEPGFIPNAWSDISGHLEKKVAALECFKSQMRAFPDARSIEGVEALAKWRGALAGFHAAEAFVQIRAIL